MEHADYYAYLRSRSRLGDFYRRFWLYPRLSRHLQGHVLDVGCGIGDMLAFRPDTVGVDINPHTVAYVRSRGLEAHVMVEGRLPFGDASFDGVVLDNVLEHIADPQPLLGEVRRVLRPGGAFLVGVPGRKGYASDPDHKVFYDRPLLKSRLEGAGFVVRSFFCMPIPLAMLDTRVSQYCLYGVFHAPRGA